MGKGPSGPFRPSRWDCRFDHLVTAALARGFGKVLVYTGIESYERADDIRRGIYRCANHRKVSAAAGPARLVTDPGEMGIRKTGGTYELRFQLFSKREARRNHLARYGTDRAAWPYDPRRPATPEERDQWQSRDERGQPVKY